MLRQHSGSRQRQQAGDTIVEVMIVLAILGLAIGISYATANRSLLNARQAQENAEATELVQGQIEALRSMACSADSDGCSDAAALFTADPYCIDTSHAGTTADPYVTVPISVDLNNYENYPAACRQGSVPYSLSVQETSPDTFRVRAGWADVTGQGNDTVTIFYRLHQ